MRLKARLILPMLGLGVILCQGGWSHAKPVETATVQMRESGHVKTIQAVATIDAPASVVWSTLVNYGNLKNVLPGYERSAVLRTSDDGAVVDLAVKAGALLPAFRYQVKTIENRDSYTIKIHRISGDFKRITASYQLMPLSKSKTRLVYHLDIDMGGRILGSGAMLKNNTKEAMSALQAHCGQTYQRALTAKAIQH